MKYSVLKSLIAFIIMSLGSQLGANELSQEIRFYSHTIRDIPPSVSEAKDYYFKRKNADQMIDEFLSSGAHKERVKRYFNDMFGTPPVLFTSVDSLDLILSDTSLAGSGDPSAPPSDLSADGVYHLPSYVKSSCGGTPVEADAWWTDGKIQICPSAVSSALTYPGDIVCSVDGPNGIFHSQCGCGPDQILCVPREYKGRVSLGISTEFQERALYIYENDRSWLDLLGGKFFYGDRWLYHHYLYAQRIGVLSQLPETADLAILDSLPAPTETNDRSMAEVPMPVSGPERAGVATAPGFFKRFNNFRSQVRALTERLLCKDVDSSLNTDGIEVFVNNDLSDFDKSHGNKAGCAGCHYALDNFGSTLLGWMQEGFYAAWDTKSQLGHVFGETGTGPHFLIKGYVERSAEFHPCMAKKAWEDFTGDRWANLPKASQDGFIEASSSGPRSLIRTIFHSPEFKNLRKPKTRKIEAQAIVIYNFNKDINPILKSSCASGGCHGAGAALEYVDNKGQFDEALIQRITDGSMPPPSLNFEISNDKRDILLRYLTHEQSK